MVNLCTISTQGCTDQKWVAYKTQEGYIYYFDTEALEGSWDKPEDIADNPAQLQMDEIKVSYLNLLLLT